MQTILDEAHVLFLDAVEFRDALTLQISEGLAPGEVGEAQAASVSLTGPSDIVGARRGRRYEVTFQRAIAWQVVDERYWVLDEEEARDDMGPLRTLGQSRYLAFVDENHGWYAKAHGPAKHYQLHTEDRIIDVVAHDPPAVSRMLPTVG